MEEIMNYLVSIIVPVYNVEKYLPECVDSILEQTYKSIEVILVDDGSTDSSGELSEKYAEDYAFVKVIHKKNAGLGFARNTGIDYATGDYITFVDGDDFIAPDHIEKLLSNIKNGNLDACYGGYCQQTGDKFIPIINPLHGNKYENEAILCEFFPHLCGKLDYHIIDEVQMSVCMVLYNASIIRDNGIRFHSERELISEDLVFNLDFLEYAKRIEVSDKCGYFYRYTEGSLSKSYKSDRLVKQTFFTKYFIDKTKVLGIYSECEQRIFSTYLAWVRAIVQGEQKNYKQVGFKESLEKIKNVCNDSFVIEVIKKYDDSNLTRKLKVMNYLIKNKKFITIWLLSYFKSLIG